MFQLDRAVQEEDTKAAKSLINIYDELFAGPRQMHLMWSMHLSPHAGATGVSHLGAPAMVAVGIAGWPMAAKFVDVGKTPKTL